MGQNKIPKMFLILILQSSRGVGLRDLARYVSSALDLRQLLGTQLVLECYIYRIHSGIL
jgi:2-phosphoglycerate kinase